MSRFSPHLTVYMPGLCGPLSGLSERPLSDWPALRGLEIALTRARGQTTGVQGLEAGLFALFGLPVGTQEDLPVAALTRLHDRGTPDGSWWLRADPIYVQIDRDRALVLAHDALALCVEEARQLADAVAAGFAEQGWHLEVAHPHRWYLRLGGDAGGPPQLQTTPLTEVLGRDMHTALPRGKAARCWRRYLNDVQMILHACALNTVREEAGRLPVNSLWFWGGGTLPPTVPARFNTVLADHPLARGLACHTDTPGRALPDDADALLAACDAHETSLLVLDSLHAAVLTADADNWLGALGEVQSCWLAPLLEALGRGRLGRLTLVSDTGRQWCLERPAWRHGWHRRRPLRDILGVCEKS